MTVGFHTLGCKLNQVETEALAASFKSRGFFIAPNRNLDAAHLVLINTCTVTSKAEQKARRLIRKILRENDNSLVILTGCYAELEREELQSFSERVFIASMDYKHKLIQLAEYLHENLLVPQQLHETVARFFSGGEEEICDENSRFQFHVPEFQFHTRAFLKIQDGCNNSCAYCRVSIARGNSVCLPPDEVLLRAKSLLSSGYKEIVLTGVNISSYHKDGVSFSALLHALLPLFSLPQRLRLGSVEPEAIDDDFLKAFAQPIVTPHLHLPIQSGSDAVLHAMGRNYDSRRVIAAAEKIHHCRDNVYLGCDVITGFPGETEADFTASLDVLKQIHITDAHVFPYSPRPGTRAYDFSGLIPERIAGHRAEILRSYAKEALETYKKAQSGKLLSVLVEQNKNKRAHGLSENYLQCRCPVNSEPGSIVLLKVPAESSEFFL